MLVLLVALGAFAPRGWAQDRSLSDADWLTGRGLDKQLDLPAAVTWSGRELRTGLRRLAVEQRCAVLLDRRIDPNQKVNLALTEGSLWDLLRVIAHEQGLGVSLVDSVAYFGPPEAAGNVRTLAALRKEEARQLADLGQRREALRLRSLEWPDLATPRGVMARVAEESGFQLSGLEQVPHDLWPGYRLPPLALGEKLTLLAIQFDLTFRFEDDARTITLVEVPDEVSITSRYPKGPQAAQVAETWRKALPDSTVEVRGEEVVVTGRLEDHERIDGTARRRGRQTANVERRWTTTVEEKPIGAILDVLARQMKLDLKVDAGAIDEAGLSLDKRVSFRVEKATDDELLEAALTPAGLTFRRQGNRVTVVPAKR